MGYTPAFDSIYTGTLYGKWPTAAVWASLLPLIDARGEINLAPEAIAGMTGWPLELLLRGIEALCQPDPRSRSKAEEGRRLVLIDPTRDWGWRAVNIGIYRSKAAGLNQVASGKNAEKVRRYKDKHRQTPEDTSRHQQTPGTPHSDSNTYSDSNKEEKTPPRATRGTPQGGVVVLHESLPREEWEQWLALRRRRRWPLDEITLGKQLKLLRDFDTETQRQIIDASIRSTWQGLFPPKAGNGTAAPRRAHKAAPTTAELEAQEATRAGR